MTNKLKQLIQNGESITTEFKESKSKLNKDIYETVCAFLNRDGGDILLGVADDSSIVGVEGDIFTTTILLDDVTEHVDSLVTEQTPSKQQAGSDQANDQVSDLAILEFCKTEKTISEIINFRGMKHITYFRNHVLKLLIEKKLIALTIPDKPSVTKLLKRFNSNETIFILQYKDNEKLYTLCRETP